MKKFILAIATVTAMVLLSGACSKEDQALYDKQEQMIESYVNRLLAENPDTLITHHGSATCITVTRGSGEELSKKGTASIYYVAYKFTGTLSANGIVATNVADVASLIGRDVTDPSLFEPIKVSISDPTIVKGLSDGLEGIKEKEERIILFNGKYSFPKKVSGTISANTPMAYHILVESISN